MAVPTVSLAGQRRSLEALRRLLLGADVVLRRLVDGGLDVLQDLREVLRRGAPLGLASGVRLLRLALPGLHQRGSRTLEVVELGLHAAHGLLDVGARLLQSAEVDEKQPVVSHLSNPPRPVSERQAEAAATVGDLARGLGVGAVVMVSGRANRRGGL